MKNYGSWKRRMGVWIHLKMGIGYIEKEYGYTKKQVQ
jgi:hypothetical protein